MKYSTTILGFTFLCIYAFVQKQTPLFYLMIKQDNITATGKSMGVKKINLLNTVGKFMIKIESSACIINGIQVNLNDKIYLVELMNNKVVSIEDYADRKFKVNFTTDGFHFSHTNAALYLSKKITREPKVEKIKKIKELTFLMLKENMEHAFANNLVEANTDLESRKTGIQKLLIHFIMQ